MDRPNFYGVRAFALKSRLFVIALWAAVQAQSSPQQPEQNAVRTEPAGFVFNEEIETESRRHRPLLEAKIAQDCNS